MHLIVFVFAYSRPIANLPEMLVYATLGGINPVRVLRSGPSLKIGCEVHNVFDPHENPNKTKFLYRIVYRPVYNNRSGKSCSRYVLYCLDVVVLVDRKKNFLGSPSLALKERGGPL
jgi:hypothetical protein